VLQCLGASDFGLYYVVGGIVVMINVLNTAMISTSFRYIAFEMGKGDTKEVNKVFNISLILHACLAFLVILLAETVGIYYIQSFLNVPAERIPDAVFVFRFSVLATIFLIFSMPFQGLITAQEQFLVRSLIEVLLVLLRLAAAVLLFYYGSNRLRLYSVLTALAVAVTSILYMVYCRRKYASIVRWNFQTDKAKYREMLNFTGWIVVGATACIGKIQGAALIINWFFGTVLNASFSIANQVNQLLLMFTQSLGQAAIPQITKSFSSGNPDRTTQLVCYVSKYTLLLMLLPALPLLLETKFLLNLWLDEVPKYTILFCQLMICCALIDCLGAAISSAVQATGNIKHFQIVISLVSLVSLPAAYILFKLGYPPSTIIICHIITSSINVVVRQIFLNRLMDFDVKRFMKVCYLKIFYVVVFTSPLFYIKSLFDERFARFVLLSALSILWFFIAVYLVGTEKNERKLLWSVFFKTLKTDGVGIEKGNQI
jgi:O-antigen/teichoic acid export membrane protein